MRPRRILVYVLLISAISLPVFLASCNGSTTIPETTKVLDEATLDCLSGASGNFSTLSFEHTTEQLSSLSVGDVIVSGVSEIAPYGLLREVTNVVFNEGQVVVETNPATLEDAIQDCAIDTSWRLQSDGSFAPLGTNEAGDALAASAEALATGFYLQLDGVVLYDNDSDLDTKGDQITADLSVNLNIDVDVGWTIRWFRLTEAHFQSTISVTSEVEASCKVAVLEIHPKLEVYRQYLAPFTVMVGPVPVVILPMLSINIGLDGELSAGITAGVTGNAELTAGVKYADGNWSPIADFSTSFEWQEPSLTAGCKVKVSAGPQLSLLLYGEAGPYIEVRGYLELDADIFRTPWWELYGGLEADVGFKVEAMGHTIADYEKPLAIGYRVLLAQAGTPTPVTLTISSTVGGSVTTPGEGTYNYDEGTVVNLVATPDAGYRFVQWTGDVDTIANFDAATTNITMDDNYSITANFEQAETQLVITTPGSGTFTVPAGVTEITVEAWGAGGSGGGVPLPITHRAGGGGGGAYARKTFRGVIPMSSIPYYVAPETGVSYTHGYSGKASWFYSNNSDGLVAAGGSGGGYIITGGSYGGPGGSVNSSYGDVVYKGGDGAAASYPLSGAGGGGAGSGGNGKDASGGTPGGATEEYGGAGGAGVQHNGEPGHLYGGGGSGATSIMTGQNKGGAGAQGLIRVTWHEPAANFYTRASVETVSTDGLGAITAVFPETGFTCIASRTVGVDAELAGVEPVIARGHSHTGAISTVTVNTTRAEKLAIIGLLVLVSVALAIWVTRRRGRGPQYS